MHGSRERTSSQVSSAAYRNVARRIISPKRLSQLLGNSPTSRDWQVFTPTRSLTSSSDRLQGRMREVVKVISAATECNGVLDRSDLLVPQQTYPRLWPADESVRPGKDGNVDRKDFARCNALHIDATNHHNSTMTLALLRLLKWRTRRFVCIFPAMSM